MPGLGMAGVGLTPPYSNIKEWVAKCDGSLAAIALLVPASVGSNWFRDHVDGKARVFFLNGRVTFVGHKAGYPKDLILCLYGPDIAPGYEVWDWRKECVV